MFVVLRLFGEKWFSPGLIIHFAKLASDAKT